MSPHTNNRNGHSPAGIDLPACFQQHRRWLRNVVAGRLIEKHAVDDVMLEVALADEKDKPVASGAQTGKRILLLKKTDNETGNNVVIETVIEDDEIPGGKQNEKKQKTITRHANGRLIVIDGDGKRIEIKIDGNGGNLPGLFNKFGGGDTKALRLPIDLRAAIESADVAPSRFMIGVHCEPVSELLRLHLGLEENVGLAVLKVVGDSAADKAGLKKTTSSPNWVNRMWARFVT